jgi:sec-independent protein translocase protein TatB
MFDVGFTEMLLVGLVALLVFGPERLPRVAREAALWIRKARDMASSVKAEVDRELQLQDLRESMAKEKREMERMILDRKPERVAGVEIKPGAEDRHE